MRDRSLVVRWVLASRAGLAETAAPPVMGVRNCRDQDAGSDKKQTRRHPDPGIRGRASIRGAVRSTAFAGAALAAIRSVSDRG